MECVKTWMDKEAGIFKGLFSCDCKEFESNAEDIGSTVEYFNGKNSHY